MNKIIQISGAQVYYTIWASLLIHPLPTTICISVILAQKMSPNPIVLCRPMQSLGFQETLWIPDDLD